MMHPLHLPILADENIHEEVVYYLRKLNLKIESIKERNLRGCTDAQTKALAQEERKVILTHDAAFGRVLHFSQEIKTGIIFLRPGHMATRLIFRRSIACWLLSCRFNCHLSL